MTSLVEDLLLLARLDDGRSLESVPVDISQLLADAVSDAHAAGPDHEWALELPEQPVLVVGDGARLHQVVANLLANARVHTPAATTVVTSVSRRSGARYRLRALRPRGQLAVAHRGQHGAGPGHRRGDRGGARRARGGRQRAR
jgi:signal transduction histidine kinase